MEVNILKKEKDKRREEKIENTLPFAVFSYPKIQNEQIMDYKQVFTNIISNRIRKEQTLYK